VRVWVVGAVKVEALVLRGRLGGNAPSGGSGQNRAECGPVGKELSVELSHRQRVIPEVDEHPDSMARGPWGVVVRHGIGGLYGFRDAEASLGW